MLITNHKPNKQTIVAYVRVSTFEQNIQRQEELISSKYTVDKWFIEKVSGKDASQQIQLQNMLTFIREGDLVVVESLSRLSRSTRDLINLVTDFKNKNIQLFSIKENLSFNNDPTGQLIFHVLAAISQFEREIIKQRQREGIEIAKVKGLYKGRPPIKKHPLFDQYYYKWNNSKKDYPYRLIDFAKDLNISTRTLSRFIKQHKILLKEQQKESNTIT